MDLAKGKWLKLEQTGEGPGARSSHAITVVRWKAYAFGGEFVPRVPVDNHLHAFDLKDRTWSVADAHGRAPSPRVGVTMSSVGETIYVFGGRDADHKELNEFYSFDTRTSTWAPLPPGPPHRSYHSMAADDRRVYVFGGCGGAGRLNDLWAFDVVGKEWVELPRPGEGVRPRGGAGLVAVGGRIWVVYGFSGVELDDVQCFDVEEGRWVEVETSGEKPRARSVFSCVGMGEYVFVYGGEIDPSDKGHLGAGRFCGDVYGLNTETLVWKKWEDGEQQQQQQQDHPGARGWCAYGSGVVEGCGEGLLVYGGNSPSNDRLDDMFFFTPLG